MTEVLDPADVRRFRSAVERRLGLYFDDGKLDHLSEIFRERLAVAGVVHPEDYLDRIDSALGGAGEWRILADRLTVGETYFFRYWDHFRAFTEVVLPDCARVQAPTRTLRILSAGCASGEEPYSLAVLVHEQLPRLFPSWNVKIVGIDVNPTALQKALRGRYSQWSLRETSAELRDRYFKLDRRDFVLQDSIRKMVTFEERNLLDSDPVFWREAAFDIVFCRNVTMYFPASVAKDVIDRITQALRPGGYLFLGHAETLRALSDEFHLRHTHGTFYYQRRSSRELRALSESPSSPRSLETLVPAAEAILDTTGTWVDAIQKASERIAALANEQSPAQAGPGPRSRPLPSEPARRSWDLGIALELLRKEKFSDAMELLKELPEESTGDPDARLLKAVLLTNSGDLSTAEAVCRELLGSDELNSGAHYLMALCREHAGDRQAALDHDQTAVYLDSGFAMPRLHLGLMAKRTGSMETARQELSEALLLLAREDAARILLFGGGFSREALAELCRRELRACGGKS